MSSNGNLPSIFYLNILEPGSQIFCSRTELLDHWLSIAFRLLKKFPSRGDNLFMVGLLLLRLCFYHHLSQNLNSCGAGNTEKAAMYEAENHRA